MGRLKSLASTSQCIALDEEFTIRNCFPFHAQIVIKIINTIPLCRFWFFPFIIPFYSHLPPAITQCIHQPVTHPSLLSFSSILLVYPICLSSCLTSIPINFSVGFLLSITPSALPLSPETRIVIFLNKRHTFTFLADGCQTWNYRVPKKGEAFTCWCCLALLYSEQINGCVFHRGKTKRKRKKD